MAGVPGCDRAPSYDNVRRITPMSLFRLALASLVLFAAGHAVAQEPSPVSFRKDIAPLLLDNCLACHGPKKAEGGYRVDTFERLTSAGDSAAPGFVAMDTESSEAYRRMVSDDPAERMPLESDPLPT